MRIYKPSRSHIERRASDSGWTLVPSGERASTRNGGWRVCERLTPGRRVGMHACEALPAGDASRACTTSTSEATILRHQCYSGLSADPTRRGSSPQSDRGLLNRGMHIPQTWHERRRVCSDPQIPVLHGGIHDTNSWSHPGVLPQGSRNCPRPGRVCGERVCGECAAEHAAACCA